MNIPPQQIMYHRGYPPMAAGVPGPHHRSSHGSGGRRGPGGPMMTTSHPHAHAHHHHHHHQASMTPAQIQVQQQTAMQQQELAKRRGRKPMDRTLPEGLEEVIGADVTQQYRALKELERRTDASFLRKRADVQDSVNRTIKRYKTLRLWISNTVENQPWQDRPFEEHEFDFQPDTGGTYRVTIEGKLFDRDDDEDDEVPLDDRKKADEGETGKKDVEVDGGGDDMDVDEPKLGTTATNAATTTTKGNSDDHHHRRSAAPHTPNTPRKRLSHFFKSISIEIHSTNVGQADGVSNVIEWRKPPTTTTTTMTAANSVKGPPPTSAGGGGGTSMNNTSTSDFDALCFERKGDEDLNITVNLVKDENPERFWVSRELGAIIDRDEDDRAGVVIGIWEYVTAMSLQDDDERRGFHCDEKLRAVFQRDHVFFPQVPDLIAPHLQSLPPIQLPYTIRVGQEYHQHRPTMESSRSGSAAVDQAAVPSEPNDDMANGDNGNHGASTGPVKNKTRMAFDIVVALDDPIRRRMAAFLSTHPNLSNTIHSIPPATITAGAGGGGGGAAMTNLPQGLLIRRLHNLDDQMGMIIQSLGLGQGKLSFLDAMAEDPVRLLHRWILSQKRDLDITLGEVVRGAPVYPPRRRRRRTLGERRRHDDDVDDGGDDDGGGGDDDIHGGQWVWDLSRGHQSGGDESDWNRDQVKEVVNLMLASHRRF